MTEKLNCPTCGSADIPTLIVAAVEEANALPTASRAALLNAVEQLYLYGDSDNPEAWEKSTRQIIGHLSPATEKAIDSLGAETAWRFFEVRFELL